MYMAERVFPALKAEPPVVEALLIPFHVEDKPVGTVWVVAHDQRRKFDREDERIIKTLAQFASSAWQLWKARNTAEVAARTEKQHAATLTAINELLQVQVSERKRAEEQLQQLNIELETRVQERTAGLATANADLLRALEEGKRLQEQLRQSQKMESIGTLAGGLAHDFNNLLQIIQAYALAIVHHSGDAEKIIEDVQVIRETVQDGAALVQQLFTVARKTEVKFVLTDINGLLQRLSKILTTTFPKTLTISLDFDRYAPDINVDAHQINHALLNLCINARDAMPDGGNLVLRTRTACGASCGAVLTASHRSATCASASRIQVWEWQKRSRTVFSTRFLLPRNQGKEPGSAFQRSTVLSRTRMALSKSLANRVAARPSISICRFPKAKRHRSISDRHSRRREYAGELPRVKPFFA